MGAMHRSVQRVMLEAHRVIFARGILRFGWGRRLFFGFYDFYKWLYEARSAGALRPFVRAGSCAVDVGANVGFFTKRFARWVGPGGHVVAIEPDATNHAELVRALAVRDLSGRVRVLRAAADAAPGTARLLINPDHPGDHRLSDEGEPVAAVTVDQAVPAGPPVSLVKIDVQGAELRVLAGAAGVVERDRPAMFVEVHPPGLALYGADLDALLGWFAERSYAPHRLRRDGAMPLSREELDRVLARLGYVDVLFLPAETRAGSAP
jgi:FkbM family methyltransferase